MLQPTNPPLKSEKVSNPAPWDFFPLSETENTYLVGVTNHVCFWHSIPTYSRLSYNPMIVEYTLRLQKFSNTPRIYKVQPYVFIICENDFSTFSPYKCTGKQILPYHKKVKGPLRIIIWTNLEDVTSQCPLPIFSHKAFFVLENISIYGHNSHLGRQWSFQLPFVTLTKKTSIWNLI